KQYHGGSVSSNEGARRLIECGASAIGRKDRCLGETDESAGRADHRYTSRERNVTAPSPNVFACRMDRRQRRRARRVHCNTWSAKVQAIRDAIRRDRMRRSGSAMRSDAEMIKCRRLDSLVIVV